MLDKSFYIYIHIYIIFFYTKEDQNPTSDS